MTAAFAATTGGAALTALAPRPEGAATTVVTAVGVADVMTGVDAG